MSKERPTFRLSNYTASEAATITGVTTDTQRLWRKRGFLPTNVGQVKYTLPTLAELKILKAMTDAGVEPARRMALLPMCVYAVVSNLLMYHPYLHDPVAVAFGGNWLAWPQFALAHPDQIVAATEDGAKWYLGVFGNSECHILDNEKEVRAAESLGKVAMRHLLTEGLITSDAPQEAYSSGVLALTSTGEHYWWDDSESIVHRNDGPLRNHLGVSAATILHFPLFAEHLIRAVPRPLVIVEIPEVSNG